MTSKQTELTESDHKQLGIDLFYHVWDLMEKMDRAPEDEVEMLHAAHASYYHWMASNPPPVNLARGEWLLSRVYCVLGRSEPALHHAQRSLDICLENKIGDFDLAFAYEALARAASLSGDPACCDFLLKAKIATEDIAEKEDKEIVLQDLDTVKCK